MTAPAAKPSGAAAGSKLKPAVAHHKAGRLHDAKRLYAEVLSEDPQNAVALHLLGVIRFQEGDASEAIALIGQAIARRPNYADAHSNLGNALKDDGRLDDAVVAYRKALELKPGHADAYYNLGIALRELGRVDDAIAACREALALRPDHAPAHNNLGTALKDQGRLADAMVAYHKALELKPNYVEALNNLGNALKDLERHEDATAVYNEVLALKPDYADAHYNLGGALRALGRLDDAVASYRRALELTPDHAGALGNLVHTLYSMCDWAMLPSLSDRLDDLVIDTLGAGHRPAETPFVSVIRCEDATRNLAIAKAWSADAVVRMAGLRRQLAADFNRPPGERIRVGYLSADFYAHATAHLMVGLFGQHDRKGFHITAYSNGPDDGSTYRRKIERDCDDFVDIRTMTTFDAARRIYGDGIDILVDLKGYTTDTRLDVCAIRPAPIQVSYLGFPGSTGADFIDYVITDKIVTPPDQAPCYTEKLAYLPHCYQVNDDAQSILAKPSTKVEFGLPEDGFVFCSFNQTYKIEAVLWEVWMRILHAVPGSVLWLFRSNGPAERNLKREAAARDVDPERIIFADKLPKPAHLARLKLADLFLDTRVCNAHTTASDALWAGLPMITLQGTHFASRVASSLLHTIGLPELITESLDEYEALAVRLARDPDALRAFGERLSRNRTTAPLFDTQRFARNLENAYQQMWDLYRAGEAPRRIDVVETTPG